MSTPFSAGELVRGTGTPRLRASFVHLALSWASSRADGVGTSVLARLAILGSSQDILNTAGVKTGTSTPPSPAASSRVSTSASERAVLAPRPRLTLDLTYLEWKASGLGVSAASAATTCIPARPRDRAIVTAMRSLASVTTALGFS